MTDQPLVSVGLQFFDNDTTLGAAIRSILGQSYKNLELILHNDGSRDRSLQVARSFDDARIRLFSDEENRKRPLRLNQSLDLARGKYYAVQDGDDIAYPDRIKQQVEFLEHHPDVYLLGTDLMVFDNAGRPIGRRRFPVDHEAICARPWAGFPMAQPTFMGRTEWFRKYGYDPGTSGGVEDQDLLLRSYQASRFANMPCILMGYREPFLSLKKIVGRRYCYFKSVIRCFEHHKGRHMIAAALLEQAGKSMVDCAAILSHLNYRILRHRARPIAAQERDDWNAVWNLYSGAG